MKNHLKYLTKFLSLIQDESKLPQAVFIDILKYILILIGVVSQVFFFHFNLYIQITLLSVNYS